LIYCCSGKIECALFGEYADLFQSLIGRNVGKLPVVVIQFGKVKLFRGYICLMVIVYYLILFLYKVIHWLLFFVHVL
jgi:hypothetical protein